MTDLLTPTVVTDNDILALYDRAITGHNLPEYLVGFLSDFRPNPTIHSIGALLREWDSTAGIETNHILMETGCGRVWRCRVPLDSYGATAVYCEYKQQDITEILTDAGGTLPPAVTAHLIDLVRRLAALQMIHTQLNRIDKYFVEQPGKLDYDVGCEIFSGLVKAAEALHFVPVPLPKYDRPTVSCSPGAIPPDGKGSWVGVWEGGKKPTETPRRPDRPH